MANEQEPQQKSYINPETLHRVELQRIEAEIQRIEETLQMMQSEHAGLPSDVVTKLVTENQLRLAELQRRKVNLSTRNIERDEQNEK